MAASPQFKIYRGSEYIGSCKYAEDAAMLMHGEGDTIRHGHRVVDTVWTEGKELQPASESYDFVDDLIALRLKSWGYSK